MKHSWTCDGCRVSGVHETHSSNQYFVGMEIYRAHRKEAPHCILADIRVVTPADVLLFSRPFRGAMERLKGIGVEIEINRSTHTVTLYRTFLPVETLATLAEQLKKSDPDELLNIVVATKDRP